MTTVATLLKEHLKEHRNDIICLLKQHGEMTSEALAEALGLTRVSVRRHLEILERQGYVAYRVVTCGRGRPGHHYSLTPQAAQLFPNSYDALACELLQTTRQCFGQEGVLRVISARAEQVLRHLAPQLEPLNFSARVAKLAEFLVERGYLADYEALPDGSFRLIERNCPTLNVAKVFSELCAQERQLYEALLGGKVVREQRIADGDGACAYRVFPPLMESPRASFQRECS
ncbi:MAG: ArsR family transcriptional regulator [Chloracidobacterium sp.]|uniref:ArsR family transcriptional regulator n=1 Tax=Chloracidobacterium validum TaxID=2821543 RepID=A0ABX8B7I6_9BACT|nr:ArsR family transcriptional regulator [Chloracidobacterium validum]QUW02644.1 ArsR family transcriptional regulator [Chloracidobacterium validum]